MPGFPPYPWYTWIAIVILWIFAFGVLWAIILGIMKSVTRVFFAAWRGVNLLCLRLFGWPLSSAGTAHWATSREVKRAGLLAADGLPLASWKATTLHEPTGGHVLVMGPPRSGKSRGLIMPCLEQWTASAVINDLRGELFDRTHTARERYGPVVRFDPGSPVSASVNILDLVRWGSHQAFGDVHRIVHHLLRPPDQRTPNPFAEAAIPLLVSIAIDRHLHGAGSFPAIVEWMIEPTRPLKTKLADLLASDNPLVTSGARRLLDQSERLRAATWNAALGPLTIFEDPTIAAHTRTSDVALDALLYGTDPLSLYLCMGFHDIARLGTFLGALVDALVAVLGSPDRPPRHKVLLCLDEMANLGALPELEKGVSYLQGSGTHLLAVFQNLPQVLETYGPHTPLLASMSTQVHYRPTDVLTAQHIAAHLGQATVLTHGARYQVGLLTTLSERTEAEHQRALLTPDEVLRLDDTDALVLTAGTASILARKLGTPPPTPAVKVREVVVAHRGACAIAAVCLLVLAALVPALTPVLQQPPSQVAQVAMDPTSPGPRFPLTLAPLDTPAAPSPLTVITPSESEPLVPWVLFVKDSAYGSQVQPLVHGRFATQEHCVAALEARFEPQVKLVEHPANRFRQPQVRRAPGRYEWESEILREASACGSVV